MTTQPGDNERYISLWFDTWSEDTGAWIVDIQDREDTTTLETFGPDDEEAAIDYAHAIADSRGRRFFRAYGDGQRALSYTPDNYKES
jgi:hypothetical protein